MDARKIERKWIEKNARGTHLVRVPMIVFVALLLTVAALLLLVWSDKRARSVQLHVKQPGELPQLLPSIIGLTQSSLDRGNAIEVLENGDQFFPRLLADIGAARETVHIESYVWWTGDICHKVADALAAKAKQGVEVRLLVDASGGHKMEKALRDEMIAAGCQVREFHPLRLSNLGRLNNRDHRKIAVIDGRIGYVGGYGYAEEWTGHAQDRKHWRDTGLRIQGPLVNHLQGAFCENWTEETGEIPAGEKYFPPPVQAGQTAAHVAYTSPTGSISSVQSLYFLAISAARHQILIQNPYMLPDRNAIDAFAAAVRRGVDVEIMVPATSATDSPVVQHASHHTFSELLKDGVHIWEYQPTLNHQKVIIVDGVWACVGSTNFDDRSFLHNDEISVGVLDPRIAAQLTAAFRADQRLARERHLGEWEHRPLWHKLLDGLAYSGSSEL